MQNNFVIAPYLFAHRYVDDHMNLYYAPHSPAVLWIDIAVQLCCALFFSLSSVYTLRSGARFMRASDTEEYALNDDYELKLQLKFHQHKRGGPLTATV